MQAALAVTEGLAVQPFAPSADPWLVGTNFERKYAAAGKRFFATAAIGYR